MRKLTIAQINLLRDVYSADEPLSFSGRKRRTVETLAKAGLITYTFIESERGRSDLLQVHKKAKKEKVFELISKHMEEKHNERIR